MDTPRISDYYSLGKEIGKGSFSSVVVGHHKRTGGYFAVKIVPKSEITVRQLDRIYTEIEILSTSRHANIVNLVEYFDEDNIYLVTELKTGGELFDRILEKGFYKEPEARAVLKQIGSAVHYLHSHGIVHRDLKPENMLFDTVAADSPLCIADFGFARYIASNELLMTPCGTPSYVAPEIANAGSYDKAVDMWSLGVIMYTLLCGFPPFFSDNDEQLLELVAVGEYTFPEPYWDGISAGAKDLISRLLQTNPADRLTAEQFLRHPWMLEGSRPSVAVPDPAVAEVSASFASLMSPTARAYPAAAANGPLFPGGDSPGATLPRSRSESAGLDPTAPGRRLSTSSSGGSTVGGDPYFGATRRPSASNGSVDPTGRRLSNATADQSRGFSMRRSTPSIIPGPSPWLPALGIPVPVLDPAVQDGSGHRRPSVSASAGHASLTMSAGSVGAYNIPFATGYGAYLAAGGLTEVNLSEATNIGLRTSSRSLTASRAFPLGPTTPPGEFSAYAQSLGVGLTPADGPAPFGLLRSDTLQAAPPPPLDRSSSDDDAVVSDAAVDPPAHERVELRMSDVWARTELGSSGEFGQAIADPVSDGWPIPGRAGTLLSGSAGDESWRLRSSMDDLPYGPAAVAFSAGLLSSSLGALAMSVELPNASYAAQMPTPPPPTQPGQQAATPLLGSTSSVGPSSSTPTFGLRVSTDLAYPHCRSRGVSMSGGNYPALASPPSLVSPSSPPLSASVEQIHLISAVSRQVAALRDSIPVLRAASESTLWMQRQQRKRSGPPLAPDSLGLLGTSPSKTLRASASDVVRDRLGSSSSDEDIRYPRFNGPDNVLSLSNTFTWPEDVS